MGGAGLAFYSAPSFDPDVLGGRNVVTWVISVLHDTENMRCKEWYVSTCICICIYICVCVCENRYVYVYVYKYLCVCMYMYACQCTHITICIYTHTLHGRSLVHASVGAGV